MSEVADVIDTALSRSWEVYKLDRVRNKVIFVEGYRVGMYYTVHSLHKWSRSLDASTSIIFLMGG